MFLEREMGAAVLRERGENVTQYLAGLVAVRDAQFLHCIKNHSHGGC